MASLLMGTLGAWLWAGVAASGTTPPGSSALRYSVNVLLGQPPHEQRTAGVGSALFAWTDTATELGHSLAKYDQMLKLDEARQCHFEAVSEEVAWSTSSSTLEAQASSSSHGLEQSSSMGVSVPVGAASVSAETTIRNAAIFGNSQTSLKQFSQRSRDYSYTFSSTATRTLYSVEVDWDGLSSWDGDFATALRRLGSAPSRSALAAFAQKFGTHGLRTATLGQQCTASAFMSSEGSMTSFEDFRSSSRSQEVALLWWTSSSSSSEADSNAQSHESQFSYSYANKRCIGTLKDDSNCARGMKGVGSQEHPAIVQWSYKPIWEMAVPGFHAGAKRSMRKFLEDLLAAAAECSARSCSGKGACAPRKGAWASPSRASSSAADLANFWDGSLCFCEPTRVGERCQAGIGVALSQPAWPARWENDLDGELDVTASLGGRRAAFCGIQSHHDNGREDRQFKMAKCLPRDSAHQSTVGGMVSYGYTSWDEGWTYECEHDKVMVAVYSQHSNGAEDRRFKFSCQRFKDTVQGRCDWDSHWRNAWDGTFLEKCPKGRLLAGLRSQHSNGAEDRRFKFRCCELIVDDAAYNAVGVTRWSSYVNDWDRPHETWAPASQAFCAMSSYHHNGHEDRRFAFKFCSVRGAMQTGSVSYHGSSTLDEGFNITCPSNRAIRYLRSYHDNGNEDRSFFVGCQAFANAAIGSCVWTPYVNAWDEEFSFQCGQDHVFSGLHSYHHNGHEDRRFSFRCCHMRVSASHTQAVAYRPVMRTAWSGYVNHWDGGHSTWASGRCAFCGMSSYHHDGHEDRRFAFKFCYVSGAVETGSLSYLGYSDWDASFTYACPGNKAIRHLTSYHDDGREDRRFSFACQAFTNSAITECSWTDYINDWDASLNFECPSGHVLAGLGSYHNNHKEDRRFRFRCCKWLVLSNTLSTRETHAGLIDMDEDLAGPDLDRAPQDERVPPNTTGRKLQAQRSREESNAVSWAATSAAQTDETSGVQLWQVVVAFPASLALLQLVRPRRGGACQQVQALEAGQTGQV